MKNFLLPLLIAAITTFSVNAQCPTIPGITTVTGTTGGSFDPTTIPCFTFNNGAGLVTGLGSLPASFFNLPTPQGNCNNLVDTYIYVWGFDLLPVGVPLSIIGMPASHTLWVNPMFGEILTFNSSCNQSLIYSSSIYNVPNNPALIGNSIFAQGFGWRGSIVNSWSTAAIEAVIQ